MLTNCEKPCIVRVYGYNKRVTYEFNAGTFKNYTKKIVGGDNNG